jgi:ABC-type phosphate transport system substrate-binding protein
MKIPRLIALAGVVLSLVAVSAARDAAIVVDRGNSVATLSTSDLAKLFKGDTAKWPNGNRVIAVFNKIDSDNTRLVLHKVNGLTPGQLRELADSHKGSILIVDSDDLVLRAVQATPGAIGVVSVYSINSGVKVLKIDGKLPLESGYLLHEK